MDWLGRRGAPDLAQDQGDFELASALDRRICVVPYAHLPLSMPLWNSMHTRLHPHMPVALASPFRSSLAYYSPLNITLLLPLSYMRGVWHNVMPLCLLSFAMLISGHVTHLHCDSARPTSRYLYPPPGRGREGGREGGSLCERERERERESLATLAA